MQPSFHPVATRRSPPNRCMQYTRTSSLFLYSLTHFSPANSLTSFLGVQATISSFPLP